MPKTFIAFGVALLLAACAASSPQPRFLHEVPSGTILALERPLPFEGDTVRVYLQGGKVFPKMALILDYGGADLHQPYCFLELKKKLAAAQTLTPREYTITGVTWDTTYSYFDRSDYRTRWDLSGGDEPQALYFTCHRLGRESQDPPIRLEEIDQVVGDYFRLKPSKPAAAP